MTSAGVWNGVFEGPQELLEVFTHCELIMIWLCVPSHFVEVNKEVDWEMQEIIEVFVFFFKNQDSITLIKSV